MNGAESAIAVLLPTFELRLLEPKKVPPAAHVLGATMGPHQKNCTFPVGVDPAVMSAVVVRSCVESPSVIAWPCAIPPVIGAAMKVGVPTNPIGVVADSPALLTLMLHAVSLQGPAKGPGYSTATGVAGNWPLPSTGTDGPGAHWVELQYWTSKSVLGVKL